jgi:hypothetical protein
VLQHYVFLRYREGTKPEHITAFCERLLALRRSIGEIRRLEIGRDELHDARSWDLVLIMAFDSVEALRAYQSHSAHQALMAFNDPFVANVASVDFTRGQEWSASLDTEPPAYSSATTCRSRPTSS